MSVASEDSTPELSGGPQKVSYSEMPAAWHLNIPYLNRRWTHGHLQGLYSLSLHESVLVTVIAAAAMAIIVDHVRAHLVTPS